MRVREIMTTEVVTVAVETPFREVAQAMLETGVSGLPVTGTDGSVAGVVSESDLMAKEAHPGKHHLLAAVISAVSGTDENWWRKAEGLTAGELMSRPAVTAGPDEPIQVAARRMLAHRINRLPVVDQAGRLVGIVSRADLISPYGRSDREITADLQELVGQPTERESDRVDFAVHDSRVTLSGTVHSPSHRTALVAAVRAVPGVVEVVDRLESDSALQMMRHSGVGVDDPNISPPGERAPFYQGPSSATDG